MTLTCDGGHPLKKLGKDQPYICHERIYIRHSFNQTKEEEQQHAGFLGATVEIKSTWPEVYLSPPSHINVCLSVTSS